MLLEFTEMHNVEISEIFIFSECKNQPVKQNPLAATLNYVREVLTANYILTGLTVD